MRRAARVDSNHSDIAKAFKKLGCSFLSLAQLGKGTPDGVVGYGGLSLLVEIKSDRGTLNEKQKKFWDTWKGGVRLVRDLDGVLETVETLKKWHKAIGSIR